MKVEKGFANWRLEFQRTQVSKTTERSVSNVHTGFSNTYWMAVVYGPGLDYRGTYYGKTWDSVNIFVPPSNPLVPTLSCRHQQQPIHQV